MKYSIDKTGNILVFICLWLLFTESCFCQGGGPPMLTDDPGTPGSGKWEINLSINSSFSDITEFAMPLVDVNYGFKDRTQIKFEMPLLVSNQTNSKIKTRFGNPLFGIKFRIIDNSEDSFFLSVYPQVSLPLIANSEKEYKFPLQIEKKISAITLGGEAGYITDGKGGKEFLNGLLIGTKIFKGFDIMTEYYMRSDFKMRYSTKIYINLGFRYDLLENLSLICSFGTQLNGAGNNSRTNFFSFTGIQWVI